MPAQKQWPQRFLDKIEIKKTTLPTPCWLWTACAPNGRPVFQLTTPKRKRVYAHRWAFEFAHGWVPDGYKRQLHHRCEQTLCVNPAHLTVLTAKEHRAIHGPVGMGKKHAAKTHCARGHEFTPENTYHWMNKRGSTERKCVLCRQEDRAKFAVRNPGYRERYR